MNSIRQENLHDGMEDYEYFWMLGREVERVSARKGETKGVIEARELLKVPGEISQDLKQFTTDPRLLLQHRERVARAIEALQKTK